MICLWATAYCEKNISTLKTFRARVRALIIIPGTKEDVKIVRTNTSEVSIFAERIHLNGKIFVNGKPLGSGGGGGLDEVLVVSSFSLIFSTVLEMCASVVCAYVGPPQLVYCISSTACFLKSHDHHKHPYLKRTKHR